jgi:hypothetical protein
MCMSWNYDLYLDKYAVILDFQIAVTLYIATLTIILPIKWMYGFRFFLQEKYSLIICLR